MPKRSHQHGPYGKHTVRNMYIQLRTDGTFKWMVAGQWCPVCGFTQNEQMSRRQMEALGV